ncbi:MAG: DUF1559 domain-containing protein [Planctomycetales bacterium]|nr:DUF1559 domain-containing protein [Planctomycetales bacterium]
MREQLLGYLIGALDEVEHAEVEEAVRSNRQYQRELEVLHESLEPLRAGDGDFDPPAGLAGRTCQFVAAHRETPTPAIEPKQVVEPLNVSPQWSFADMAVAAGIFLAAGMLLLPAIQQSRVVAQRTECQNNLREIGQALQRYADTRNGLYPEIPANGNQSVAGIFSVRLMEGEFLDDPSHLLCPAAAQGKDDAATFRLPTAAEIDAATGEQLVRLQRMLGGNFGYSLGYRERGRYHAPQYRGRANYALVADAPDDSQDGFRSANHGGCGQNVLYEDGHVGYLKGCSTGECRDHIFLNDENVMAAGVHANDSVIGHSWSRPLLESVRYGAATIAE